MVPFLLFAILCVLLFGASAVLTGAGFLLSIGVLFALMLMIAGGIGKAVNSTRSLTKSDFWPVVCYCSLGANIILVLVSKIEDIPFSSIPFSWLPPAVLIVSALICFISFNRFEYLPESDLDRPPFKETLRNLKDAIHKRKTD